jgi:hypothetical protein
VSDLKIETAASQIGSGCFFVSTFGVTARIQISWGRFYLLLKQNEATGAKLEKPFVLVNGSSRRQAFEYLLCLPSGL